MNTKQIGYSVLLAGFVGLNIYAVEQHGFVGVFETALATPAGVAVFVDLVIALSLLTFYWLVPDARDRGFMALPYFIVTLFLGSVGPLLYLIRREGSEQRSARAVARAA